MCESSVGAASGGGVDACGGRRPVVGQYAAVERAARNDEISVAMANRCTAAKLLRLISVQISCNYRWAKGTFHPTKYMKRKKEKREYNPNGSIIKCIMFGVPFLRSRCLEWQNCKAQCLESQIYNFLDEVCITEFHRSSGYPSDFQKSEHTMPDGKLIREDPGRIPVL